MIRIKSERVLLVAPEAFSVERLSSNKETRHINAVEKIFPAIHEMKPNMILFDQGMLGKESEKVLRRLKSNNHYTRIKICCYKAKYEPKADDMLKCLGVDTFIYQSELDEQAKKQGRNIAGAIGDAIEASVMRFVSSVAY